MYLDTEHVRAALAVRDLTDPAHGPHAMQRMCDAIVTELASTWGAEVRVVRRSPVVTERDNYDRLYYPSDGASRGERYTRWIGPGVLLRTQTSAMIPSALDELARDPTWRDVVLVCPGVVYRRDCIDRHHVGEPHQMDVWRIRRDAPLYDIDLRAMVARVVEAALPGWTWRAAPAVHPYTEGGLQIDAAAMRDGVDGAWLEIAECGLAAPRVLAAAGLDPATTTGLAMGLGLDRLVMLRKGIADIRLLRTQDPRIASQLLDLAPYRAVSAMPPAPRDLSIVVDADDTAEDLGDRVRAALGDRAAAVESVEVVTETAYDALPPPARTRLGIAPGQKNLLVRVVLRDLERTLSADDANVLRDRIYAALHRGMIHHWAAEVPGVRW